MKKRGRSASVLEVVKELVTKGREKRNPSCVSLINTGKAQTRFFS